jgi:hypothetical protein
MPKVGQGVYAFDTLPRNGAYGAAGTNAESRRHRRRTVGHTISPDVYETRRVDVFPD